jgi:hypothetical protein
MKKLTFCLMATCLSLTLLPLQLNAATTIEPSSLAAPKPAESAEVKTMELRLNEIKAMDKSNMKSAEKKNLRKEVKSINHRMRDIGGGVYLSVGAIILIVILLVVLL